MPRFVLLYHECPPNYARPSHWDFMLESGNVLRTWAIEQLPRDWQVAHARTTANHPNCAPLATGNSVPAAPLGDHRRDYLELEGRLTGNRGTIVRVAAGTYHSESELPNSYRIVLTGNELTGQATLTGPSSDSSRWTLAYGRTS